MGKGSKIFGILCLILGIACFALYFVIGDKFSNYKVIFDSDGGTTIQEQVIKKGEKAIKPTDPVKDNNEFVEWQLNGVAFNFNDVVSQNMTLKAKWNLIVKHNVKVTLEGQEYNVDIRDGEKVTADALKLPDKEGFRIKFYNENQEEFNIDDAVKNDLTLTADYVAIKYFTVKFNSNGGSAAQDLKVEEGKQATEPTTMRDGYIFAGWYLGEEKFDFTTPITKDIQLKARWNDGPKINVIFMVDGKVYKTVAINENTTVAKPSNPTKKGYRFVEWQLEGKPFNFKDKIPEETTLTAYFEEVTSFTVTFNTDGGSSVPSQTVTSTVTKPADPTRKGYRFVEWQLNGKAYDFKAQVTSDIQLKAIWAKLPQYTVRFNNDDNTEITTQTVDEGSKATRPTDPVRENYSFAGWIYNNAVFDFNTPITKDMVLTARFVRTTNPDEPTVPDNGE